MKVPALLGAATLFAAFPFQPTFAAEPPAAPPPAAATQTFSPIDLEALRAVINQTVSVEGTVAAAAENKTQTVRYLNFTRNFKESVGMVFFVKKGGDEFSLEKLKAWEGKKVRVTGKVQDHNGNLQIEVERWDQVQEIPQ